MPLYFGANKAGSLYLGSTKIGAAYMGNVKVYEHIPDNVLIFKFSNSSYDPTSLTTITDATWTQISTSPNVWRWDARAVASTNWKNVFYNKFNDGGNIVDIIDAGRLTTALKLGDSRSSPYPGMFAKNSRLNSVCKLVFPNATSAGEMFKSTYNITIAGLVLPKVTTLQSAFSQGNSSYLGPVTFTGDIVTTSALTNVQQMFQNQISLTTAPYFETSGVTNMTSMYKNTTGSTSSLTQIPLYHTDSVTDVTSMCYNCRNVETGALALYQQMITQTNPPTTHQYTFRNCGADTVTGAAELAQIPSDWK